MFEQYNDILSVEEVCELLSIGRNGLYKLLGSGEIKAFQYGGRIWKIPKKEVEAYIMRKCRQC